VRLASTPVRLDLSRSRPAAGWVAAGVVAVASVIAMLWLDVGYPPLPVMIPTTDMYEVHVDFDTFWHSAVALWQGNDIYTTPAKLTNLNPTLLTVLLAPFAWLDAPTGKALWFGLSVGSGDFVYRHVDDLADGYRAIVEQISDDVAGFCWTQLTDVEQEQNGLLTAGRRPKVDPELLRPLTRREKRR